MGVVKLAEEYAQIEKRSNQTELSISPMLALSVQEMYRHCLCSGEATITTAPVTPVENRKLAEGRLSTP